MLLRAGGFDAEERSEKTLCTLQTTEYKFPTRIKANSRHQSSVFKENIHRYLIDVNGQMPEGLT